MVIINGMDTAAFHRLLPKNLVSNIDVGEEFEWYGDRGETIFGAIGVSRKKGWSFAIVKQDESGRLQVSQRQGNFPSRHTARVGLLLHMTGAEADHGEFAAKVCH
jgi:hypothetical protein